MFDNLIMYSHTSQIKLAKRSVARIDNIVLSLDANSLIA
jgi:hypothetical protein